MTCVVDVVTYVVGVELLFVLCLVLLVLCCDLCCCDAPPTDMPISYELK